jgi:hypothetical protein
MGRPSYVCTVCSEHFTRKYSAKRHNHNIHNGAAEIVRLIDYLAGRSSGQYMPDNPFWYKRNNPFNNVGSTTVADTVGDTFNPIHIPKQAPLGTSQYSTSPTYRSADTSDDQTYGTSLSQEKILELKRLINKYSRYCTNPDALLELAIYNSINGDNTLLDGKLEQLRTIDRRLNGWS